jgi:cell division protein FtsI (penicillin-binding protein 3)
LPASRGDIYDRNGAVLASSLPVSAITADPRQLKIDHPRAQELAAALDMTRDELKARLESGGRGFTFLKRQVEPEAAARVFSLRIPGVHQQPEYLRYYPVRERLAHIVGFTDVEDRGQEGVELSHNAALTGEPGSRRVIRDKLGRIIEEVETIREPRDGQPLVLSIDATIQSRAFSFVQEAVAEHKAQAGAAVVLDSRTGELLAVANWPSYDPNERANRGGAQVRNRAITDTFEPGSTLKPFTAALGLESGRVHAQTVLQCRHRPDCPGHPLKRTLGDPHAGWLWPRSTARFSRCGGRARPPASKLEAG